MYRQSLEKMCPERRVCPKLLVILRGRFLVNCNVSLLANKPCRWKSMLTHQVWFNLLIYATFTRITYYRVCNLPIYLYPTPRRHITSPAEKSRPETWPRKHMGKATLVWQLTLSHRCHQMLREPPCKQTLSVEKHAHPPRVV